jgi:hypothetical protein
MDSAVNQLAREMTDAIAAAVAGDAKVEACREKARAAGFELKVTLDASVGFIERGSPAQPKAALARRQPAKTSFEMSANDRRFLKSLRISSDETTEKGVE